jgi:hypothetical protein
MTALLKQLSESQATPTAEPRNSMTAAVRRFCSKIWSEFGTKLRNDESGRGYYNKKRLHSALGYQCAFPFAD